MTLIRMIVCSAADPRGVRHKGRDTDLANQAPTTRRKSTPQHAALWLLDAIAQEVLAEGGEDRWALISDLRAKAGYRCAEWPLDPETQQANDRIALVERLAAQVAGEEEGG